MSDVAPACGPTSLEVPLFPRSAQALLDILEGGDIAVLAEHPGYVVIDVENFRNQLRAHLERVAIGE